MRVCSLAAVKSHIVLGRPLPFGVRDAERLLLLARGQVITDEDHLAALLRRGAVVDIEELGELAAAQPAERRAARPALRMDQLPGEWLRNGEMLREALRAPGAQFEKDLHGAAEHLLALIDAAPDVALSQVVLQPDSGVGHYGINHSIHAATACQAAARFMGWSTDEQRRAVNAALTMNIAMVDLQARLATQVSPLTNLQRETINNHPLRSAEMLGQAGVADELWLDAVRLHHELPDGSGYPERRSDVSELSELLRFADVYTARLSSRANRPAMSAQQAGRELHQMGASSPLAAALIKSFGIFPPGSMVRLASGELGVVVRNGEKAYHPQVATLTDVNGDPRLTPHLRDTAREGYAVVALLSRQAMPMRLTDEKVAALIGGT